MTILSTVSTEIKSHLLAIVVVVGLLVGSIYAVDSLIARHDAATASRYELLLKQSQATTAADEQAFQNTLAQLTAQNAQLSASIAKRDAALATVLKADAQLSAQQAATKLGGKALPDNTVDLPIDASRKIAAQLDMLPACQANLTSETGIASNLQIELDSQTKVVSDLQAELVAQDSSYKAQIKLLKAKNRKRDIKIFFIGAGAGAAAVLAWVF